MKADNVPGTGGKVTNANGGSANSCRPAVSPDSRQSLAGGGYANYFWQKAQERPHLIIPGVVALLNGYWHRLKFFVTGKRFSVGPGFRVYGKFRVVGPGEVRIGKGCFVLGEILRPVSFVTWSKNSLIVVGDEVGFNGTVINCYDRVVVDDLCNIADAYIIDSSAHHLSADRRHLPLETVASGPVHLCRNVWVSLQAVILKGVTIGENSVVGACSLVREDVPANAFVGGYPAKKIRDISPKYKDCPGRSESGNII